MSATNWQSKRQSAAPNQIGKWLPRSFDNNGQDVEPHGGMVAGVIKAVRNFLNADPNRPAKLPGAKAIEGDYALFLKLVPDIIAAARFDPWDHLHYRDVLTVIHEGQQALPT